MAGSRYWWYRWTGPDGKRHAVSTKTDDESEAIVRARAIHVDFTQTVPKNPLVPLIDRYLDEAQSRNKNPMRPETARNVRYALNKFVTDTGANYVSDKIAQWLGDGVEVVERSYGHLAPADQDINLML
jgi:hypothetical protein